MAVFQDSFRHFLCGAALFGASVLSPWAESAAQAPAVLTPPQADIVAAKRKPPGLEQALTLQEVLRKTYTDNPDLEAARAEALAVQELLPQAHAGWKPTIRADGNIQKSDIEGSNFGGADGSASKNLSFSVNQPIYRGGQTSAEISSARNTIAAQDAILSSVAQRVMFSATTAYMDVLRDQAIVELNQNNVEVVARQLEASRQRFEVGEITRTDVSQSEARLAEAQANLIRARGNLQSSLAVFEQVVGLPPGRKLLEPVYNLGLPENLREAVNIALENNPNVIAATYIQKAAEDDVDGVFGELLPQINAFASWSRTLDPQPGVIDKETVESVGLEASVPLYEGGAVRSRVRQAKHVANQNYLEILSARREAQQQAVSNWENLRAAKAEIQSRQAQVRAAELAREGVQEETLVGTRTVLDALDADQELLDAKVELVTANRNAVVAAFALATTLGRLTPEVLGFERVEPAAGSFREEIGKRIFGSKSE